MDFDLVRSCYHPDAIDRHGAYEGGVEGFIKWAGEVLPLFDTTMHFTGNQYVKVARQCRFRGALRAGVSPHETRRRQTRCGLDCERAICRSPGKT